MRLTMSGMAAPPIRGRSYVAGSNQREKPLALPHVEEQCCLRPECDVQQHVGDFAPHHEPHHHHRATNVIKKWNKAIDRALNAIVVRNSASMERRVDRYE